MLLCEREREGARALERLREEIRLELDVGASRSMGRPSKTRSIQVPPLLGVPSIWGTTASLEASSTPEPASFRWRPGPETRRDMVAPSRPRPRLVESITLNFPCFTVLAVELCQAACVFARPSSTGEGGVCRRVQLFALLRRGLGTEHGKQGYHNHVPASPLLILANASVARASSRTNCRVGVNAVELNKVDQTTGQSSLC